MLVFVLLCAAKLVQNLVAALIVCGHDPPTLRRTLTFTNVARLLRQAESGQWLRPSFNLPSLRLIPLLCGVVLQTLPNV